ncbi:MAG TPA: GspE/PulE family protein [Pirellulaceae bacterium]|nr:GspE/PulE family protein [Pirellulaceae bacterium]
MPSEPSTTSELDAGTLACELRQLSPQQANYATAFVERLLATACARAVSDIHLTPASDGLVANWRVNGVLEPIGLFSPGVQSDVVARLKVLADLLTYRQEIPQEGRLRVPIAGLEMRVSTFPTLFGERAVVRIFRRTHELETLAELQLPGDLLAALRLRLAQTQGAIVITGPAGSGKTTTAYACLRELLSGPLTRSIVTLEDPIEAVLSGVAQSAMQPAAGFDFATALRSVLRQDPEVILVGEVRDRETALAAFQAALTGHLVLTTFHAGSAATALSRFSDMGIEPYLLRSGIQAIIGQRLVRRLCSCAVSAATTEALLGRHLPGLKQPVGCAICGKSGYQGRLVLAEMLPPLVDDLGRELLIRADAPRLDATARCAGMISLGQRAVVSLQAGQTSAAEVLRVLGHYDSNLPTDL